MALRWTDFFRLSRRSAPRPETPEDAWTLKLNQILTAHETRQPPPSVPILLRLIFWPNTAPGKSSPHRSTGKSPGWAASSHGWLRSSASRLDQLSPRLRLGTRLLWRPAQKLKHRALGFLLSRLIPVLLNALLSRCCAARTPSRCASSATPRARPVPSSPRTNRTAWLLALSARQLCRMTIRNSSRN